MDCHLSHYTDYLLSTPKYATATGMSQVFDGKISHDKITRFLAASYLDNTSVWKAVKPLIRKQIPFEDDQGVIIVDDSIAEKPHTDENALICWHYDHSLGRMVKGINFVSLLYAHGEQFSVPLQVALVEKTEAYVDSKSGKTKYKSEKTKNELFRDMLSQATQLVNFKYVLGDSWFSSAENIGRIVNKLGKHAILAVQSSRTVALSDKERKNGQFQRVDQLGQLQEGQAMEVYLRSVDKPVLLVKQVFTNQDGSQGTLFLIATDLTLSWHDIITIYKKRWKVEQYHKSLKLHTAFSASPTKTIETQANHFYAAIIAYIKLEKIKWKTGHGHFRLKAILMLNAAKASLGCIENWLA